MTEPSSLRGTTVGSDVAIPKKILKQLTHYFVIWCFEI